MDSSQAWFCRDLWVDKARDGVQDDDASDSPFRYIKPKTSPEPKHRRQLPDTSIDPDANAGSDFDAMPEDSELPFDELPATRFTVPNSAYSPSRILVNPRCVTTYAGVSHTQLALDLFGAGDDDGPQGNATRNVLDDWEGAPDSFVCQEQRYVQFSLPAFEDSPNSSFLYSQTGGRVAAKTQRLLGFSIHDELTSKTP